MHTEAVQKYGTLDVIRGGQWAKPRRRRPRTPNELRFLDRARRAYAAMRDAKGRAPTRAHREIAQGRQDPLSIAAKHATDAAEAGVPLEENEKPVIELLWFVRSLYHDVA